jgi:hypothetical protein
VARIPKIILDGLILSLFASVFIVISMRLNPRIWLHDYPPDIQAQVASKTRKEKRLSLLLSIPFLILLAAIPLISTLSLKRQYQGEISFFSLAIHAFGVAFVFNVVDWLILDWLMFCTITPRFVVIPGSEEAAGYKNYGFHFRGFLKGIVFSVVAGLIIAAITLFI